MRNQPPRECLRGFCFAVPVSAKRRLTASHELAHFAGSDVAVLFIHESDFDPGNRGADGPGLVHRSGRARSRASGPSRSARSLRKSRRQRAP